MTADFRPTYTRRGEGDILVLVHGALADERMWAPHIELLQSEYDVIALTQRHFGPGGRAHQGGFGTETHGKDLARFLDTLDTDRPVHVAAWSYGADVVLSTLARRPGRIRSAFLYEPGNPACLTEQEMALFGQDAERMFGPVFPLVQHGQLTEAVVALMDGSGGRAGYFLSQTDSRQQQQLQNAHTLPLQMGQSEATNLSCDALAAIDIPVAVAYGGKTRTLFNVVSRAAGSCLGNGRTLEVEEATHLLPLDSPHEFVRLLKVHLGSVSPEPGK
ncbi:alpha/beta fold hydrolase [Gilvimarinus sp. F26214L]|uniref:alpha/beta fold hydrolase n=1 Tax=Gilvimarinus sp. DZF01 TaxID=3461371 RepID=UPI0040456BA6